MAEGTLGEPIAVVGMGCSFPGASTPREFWEQLRRGADLVGEAPAGRWRGEAVALGEPGTPGCASSLHGGFLDDVDMFDA